MIPDPIVQEVRATREAHAARFNYDLTAIFVDLKRSEQQRAKTTASLVSPPTTTTSRSKPSVRGVRFSQR